MALQLEAQSLVPEVDPRIVTKSDASTTAAGQALITTFTHISGGIGPTVPTLTKKHEQHTSISRPFKLLFALPSFLKQTVRYL